MIFTEVIVGRLALEHRTHANRFTITCNVHVGGVMLGGLGQPHQDTRFGTSHFFALLAASCDPKDEEKYCFVDEHMP